MRGQQQRRIILLVLIGTVVMLSAYNRISFQKKTRHSPSVLKKHGRTDACSTVQTLWPPGDNASMPCRDCIETPWKGSTIYASRIFNSNNQSMQSKNQIYMSLLVPPDFGSSILLNTLSSSPAASNMCKNPYDEREVIPWQCESTWTLIHEGVFAKKDRWDATKTNFTLVYETFDRLDIWTNSSAPILLDKSPPNIGKSQELVDFFQQSGKDYRIVVMWRHPYRKQWEKGWSEYLESILNSVPPSKRFLLDYDDLLLRPHTVLENMLNWLPDLQSLKLNTNELNPKGIPWLHGKHYCSVFDGGKSCQQHRKMVGARRGSLEEYVFSNSCQLSLTKPDASMKPKQARAWARYAMEMAKQHNMSNTNNDNSV